MLSILPVFDKKLIDEYNNKTSLKCEFAFSVTQNENILGYCLYNINNNRAFIENITVNENDFLLTDGLVRAVLSSVNQKGINCCTFNKNIIPLIKELKILDDNSNDINNISGFFGKGCKI